MNEFELLLPDPSLFEDWRAWARSLSTVLGQYEANRNPTVFGVNIEDESLTFQKLVRGSFDSLILDPSFEGKIQTVTFEPDTPWFLIPDGGTWTIVDAPIRTGIRSARLDVDALAVAASIYANGDPAIASNHPIAIVGDEIYFEFYCRQADTAPSGNRVQAVIEFRDSTGVVVQTIASTAATPTTTFTKFSIVAACTDADAAYVTFSAKIAAGDSSTTAYVFDDFYARRLINTEQLAQNAASALEINVVTDDTVIFDGTDEDTWRTLGNVDIEVKGGNPVLVITSGIGRVDQVRSDDTKNQVPTAAGPHIEMRLIRFETANPPTNKYSDTEDGFVEVFRPDEPISISTVGYVPIGAASQYDTPPNAIEYTYELQLRWRKFEYNIGTVSVSAGLDTVTGSGTAFRTWLDPEAGSVVIDFLGEEQRLRKTPLEINVNGGGWKKIDCVNSDTELLVDSVYGANESGVSYITRDPSVAPILYSIYNLTQAIEQRR